MKRSPSVALVLLAAIVCGLALLPSSSGAQGRKGQPAQSTAAAPGDAASPAAAPDSGEMTPALVRQIESLVREKESRTPAQQKLDSQLVYAIKQARGEPITEAVERLETGVRVDERGRTAVDISGQVTKRVLAAITNEGGTVVNYFKSERSIRAELPLASVEKIALLSEVRFIRPADELQLEKVDAAGRRRPAGDTVVDLSGKPAPAATAAAAVNPTLLGGLRPGFAARAAVVGRRLPAALAAAATARAARDEETPVLDIGAVTAESDTTHRTREARNFFGLNGKGLKIGIISDSFNDNGGYPADIASGDLPGPGNPFGYTTPVTVVQESTTTDEGRAMAQIIHDIVPGAQLFFATANGGQANFANNIRVLRNTHGCDVIVDDVGYFLESPLHKSAIVSKAVDDVVAAGAMYFASAGNAGNLNDGTSGVWEGDFSDAGANTGGIVTVVAGGTFHDFDAGAGVATQNPVNRTTTDNRPANLFWSDPLGGSANDYDLYLISGTLDAGGAGAVVAAATNLQTGTQDPAEQLTVPGSASGAPSGRRIAVFKKATAATRFIHVTLNRSQFDPVNGAAIPAFVTSGQANGHDATGDGYATAATPADGPFPSTHSGADVVETFSSDGLRRIFYDYDNAPLNTNLTATGGAVLQKPDITAADGVMTTVPGFQPFFGTSAAAPTAAAIAALLKASNNALTAAQILPALDSTAIDIEAAGFDRDSGVGIVSPYPALQALNARPGATLDIGTVTFTPTSGCDSGFDAGERAAVTVALNNVGGGGATAIAATLTSQTPGVTVVQSTSGYPDIAAAGTATNLRQFTVATEPGAVACGAKLKFSLAATFAGGQASPAVFPVTVQTAGTPGASPTNVTYSGSPAAIPDNNAAGVNIPLTVSGFAGSVSDLNFRFGGSSCNATTNATTNGVNHNFVGDLVFKLTSPSGTTVTIISQAGGANNSGNNFCNTVLDDDTANGSIQSVTAAQNPYTGTFKPATPLSAFDGENPNGTWILNASDVGATDVGNVTAFSLDISEFSCAALPTTTISGRVTDGSNNGVDAVNLSLTGTEQQATTTDSNGDYSFTLSTCGGIYTVTPTKAGHTFTPPQATFVNVAGSQTANFAAANAVTPSGASAGDVVISEFRARGAAGALDEFVEIANRTDSAVTVGASDGASAGWLLAALNTNGTSSTAVYTIPNGTVIPARGRYLVAGRGYTLNDYAAGDAYTFGDIPDNTGLALFDSGTTSGAVLDAAGFDTAGAGFADTYREGGGMPPVGTTGGQYSLVRSLATGSPRDTGSNADDFILVAPDAGTYGGRQSRLGAPGPENTGSPVNRNDRLKASLIDNAQSNGASPNTVRDFTSYTDSLTPTTTGDFTNGTFSIRRRFTNQTINSVSRLRFRIVDATAGPAAAGTADLRLLSSPDLVVGVSSTNCASPPCMVNLAALTLEQPATQGAGGGLNSTVAAGSITPGTPIAPGASVSVEFRLGVRQTGAYRFFITVEALP